MKSRSNSGWIIWLIIAVIAAIATYTVLSAQKATIYVFNKDLPAGSQITKADLTALQVDKSLVQAAQVTGGSGYVTDSSLNKVLGSPLRYDVSKGMPLMSAFTDAYAGTPAEKRLSPNMVAVTVEADNVTAGSPKLGYGSRVNVYVSYENNNSRITYLLLQNIAVLDVVAQESSSGNAIQGVTLEVTPEQSVALSFAAQFGKIRLGLIKQGNYQETQVPPYTGGGFVQSVPAPNR